MLYIVNVSGGLASYEAMRRCMLQHPHNTIGVFADTLIEDADLYRFLDDLRRRFGWQIERLADGRTPWEVMRDERAITIQSAAPCSKLLKRTVIDRWVARTFAGQDITRVFGFDWTEPHRAERISEQLAPTPVWCPLLEPPYVTKQEIAHSLREYGIEPPRLYALGFPHNNCGGGCVRAGQGHFAHLLRVLPAVYADWERHEGELRDYLGKDVSILHERRGDARTPVSLAAFRARVEDGQQYEADLWAGCGCFTE